MQSLGGHIWAPLSWLHVIRRCAPAGKGGRREMEDYWERQRVRVSGGGRAAVRNKRTNSSPTHRQWERSRESCGYFTSPTLSRLPFFPTLPARFHSSSSPFPLPLGSERGKEFLGGLFFLDRGGGVKLQTRAPTLLRGATSQGKVWNPALIVFYSIKFASPPRFNPPWMWKSDIKRGRSFFSPLSVLMVAMERMMRCCCCCCFCASNSCSEILLNWQWL